MSYSSMASKNASIDRAMEEGAEQDKKDIGKYVKANKLNSRTCVYTPVEGKCVNVFFSHQSDAIVYNLVTAEGKRIQVYSWEIKSIQ